MMSRQTKWIVMGCVWLSAVFLFSSLFQTELSPDGALFGTWSRYIGTWRDPLLLSQPVDKPPLLFYLQALFLPFFGAQQWTPMLPNVIASLLLIPLTARLSWRLYRNEIGVGLTAVFLTLLPIHRYYATTALTDPLLLALLITSLLCVSKKWYTLSGLFFGLALATKYQALFFIPLLIWGLETKKWELRIRKFRRWFVGTFAPFVLLALWQIARSDSLVDTQWTNFGGIRLSYSWELWSRLIDWLAMGWSSFGILGLIWLGSIFWMRGENRDSAHLLNLFIVGYLLFHWLVAIPIWSRYLLLITPLMVMQTARFIGTLSRKWGSVSAVIITVFLLFNLPIESPLPTQFDKGIPQLSESLQAEPYGTVLYDNYYSWQLRYALFDTGVFVAWTQSPRELSADIVTHGTDGTRYIMLPNDERRLPWVRAIEEAGGSLSAVSHTEEITLYQIQVKP